MLGQGQGVLLSLMGVAVDIDSIVNAEYLGRKLRLASVSTAYDVEKQALVGSRILGVSRWFSNGLGNSVLVEGRS